MSLDARSMIKTFFFITSGNLIGLKKYIFGKKVKINYLLNRKESSFDAR